MNYPCLWELSGGKITLNDLKYTSALHDAHKPSITIGNRFSDKNYSMKFGV